MGLGRRLVTLAIVVGQALFVPTTTASAEETSAQMIATHNAYRVAAGAPPVAADASLERAAQSHSAYLRLNNTGGHFETAGKPGYTGYAPLDRARAAGYRGAPVSEVATPLFNGVHVLWHAPYHRLGMMHPQAVAAGWSGTSPTIGDIGYDFSRPAPDVVRSPAAGQLGIPTTWPGDEYPRPQPEEAVGPFGYPIMAVYSHGRYVELRGARLTGPGGAEIEFWVAKQEYERDYVLLVPKYPLPPASRIHVRMDLVVGGRALTDEWDFFTVALPERSRGAIVPGSRIVVHARPGSTVPVSVTYKNTGRYTWGTGPGDTRSYAGVAELVLTSAHLRVSCAKTCEWVNDLADGWPNGWTPAQLAPLAPGTTATATFRVRAPTQTGTYELPVRLRGYEQGALAIGEPGCNCAMGFFLDDAPTVVSLVVDTGYRSAWAAQSPYPLLLPGEVSPELMIQFRNTGELPWLRGVPNAQANLGVVADDVTWLSLGVGWPLPNRVAIQDEARVDPGGLGTFRFRVRAPSAPGRYRIFVRPVIDGVTWMEDQGVFIEITVPQPGFHSRWVSQTPYPTLAVGQSARVSVVFRNTGQSAWAKGTASEARLGLNRDDRSFAQLGMALNWLLPDRPAVQEEQVVAPGQRATFTFDVRGTVPGTYPLHLRPVVDGVAWMEDEGVYAIVTVR